MTPLEKPLEGTKSLELTAKVKVEVDDKELDKALEKANRIAELLREIDQIIVHLQEMKN